MSNTVVNTIKVTGDRHLEIKDLFEKSKVPTPFGHAWDLKEYNAAILCDVKHGDGITVQDDAIVIRGESKNSPPLDMIHKMSKDYPGLLFIVESKEVLNCYFQTWIFHGGEGWLKDCVQGAYEGEGEEIVYMRDGKQINKFPIWVAANDHPDFCKDG
jgi:hypothetical protein